MKKYILLVLLTTLTYSDLSAQQSQNSISVQGRLSSTEAVSGVQVAIFANGISVSTASPINLLPDQNGVFTSYIAGFDPMAFQIPAGLFEISLKKDDVEIAKIPLMTVPFALAVRGVKEGDNIIGASGNIGIGTINPEKKLSVTGDVLIDGDLYARNLIGAVMFFAGPVCPGGWLMADGSTLPVAGMYSALFSYIGYIYGQSENGFRLPDMLDGSFIRSRGGYAAEPGIKQADAFEYHSHGYLQRPNNASRGSGSRGVTSEAAAWAETGGVGDVETRPQNYAMTPCIKY